MKFLTSLVLLTDGSGGEKSIILSLSRSLCAFFVYEDVLCEGKIFLEESQNRDTNLFFSVFL